MYLRLLICFVGYHIVTGQITLTVPPVGNCGDNIVMTCKFTDTTCTSWGLNKDGAIILEPRTTNFSKYSYTGSVASGTMRFTIKNMELSDAAAYVCSCRFDNSPEVSLDYECKSTAVTKRISEDKRLELNFNQVYPNPSSVSVTVNSNPLPGTHTCTGSTSTSYSCTWTSSSSLEDVDSGYRVVVRTITETPLSGSIKIALTLTGNGCPSEDSGFAFITSACDPANDVSAECKHIFKDYNNQQKKVCKKLEVTTNSTGCSAGSAQFTTGFQYTVSDAARKLKVNIICNLLKSSKGDTVHDSRTCMQDYYIDACCPVSEIVGYVLFGIAVTLLITVDIIICLKICKGCNWRGHKLLIGLFIAVILIILGLVVGVMIVAFSVVPILPDGELDECCDCTSLIVYAVFMGIFTVVGIVLLSVVCYQYCKGEEPRNRTTVETTEEITMAFSRRVTDISNTPEKKKALSDKTTKNEPQRGKPVLPRIVDNRMSRIDSDDRPRPLPPIKKGQD